jgi:hypothetical protein
MHFSAIAFLSLATTAVAGFTSPIAALRIKNTDRLIFNTTLPEFLAAAARQDGAGLGLDWTTDGCSSAPETPFDFNCNTTR